LEINKLLLLHLVGSYISLYLLWWCTFKHKSNYLVFDKIPLHLHRQCCRNLVMV